MLRTALLVAGKDLRQRLRDRSALVIAFIAPSVLAAIIGLAFGGDAAFRATYAVADADRGPVAAGFTDGVLASPGLRDLVTVREVDPGEARALAAAEARRLGERAAAGRLPVRLAEGQVGGRTIEAANYFGPSMAIFFLFFTVSFGARSVLAERRQGTMRRLLASAASPSGVLAGKALAAFVLGTASVLVMWLATTLVFGADWGDPVAVVALTISSVLSVIGITALVVTLARSEEQAEGFSSLVVFTLALLGGNFVYLAQLPETLQRVSLLTPNGWALRGFVDLVADGGGLATVAVPVAVTLAVGLATGGLALYRARRMVAA